MLFKKLKPPYSETSSPFLYFSFCNKDNARARKIIMEFQSHGILCYYDLCQSPVNSDKKSEDRMERLLHCIAFVCLMSDAYQSDLNCRFEMEFARKNGKQMIPIGLGSSGDYYDMNLALSNNHSYLISPAKKKKAVKNLVRDIICENPSLSEATKRPKLRPNPYSSFIDTDDPFDDEWGSKPASKPARAAKKREEEQKEESDKVSFSILSPRAVKPDTYGVIDLHMYTAAQREAVDRAIRESNGLVNETTKDGFKVKRETSITARLESKDVEISDPLETQVWTGEKLHFDFRFYVPETYSRSQIAFACYIECNGIPFTRLNFLTAVSKLPESGTLPAKITRSDFKKAFISYSRKDEQRMLSRVLGIQELVPEMKFWLDKQSMDAGDLWREEIRKAINISDVLLLFWSVYASKSAEVEKEWRYGLEQRGLSFIAPVPLDPPSECPPPEDLGALNFSVRSFSQNEITEKLSFFNSENIQVL